MSVSGPTVLSGLRLDRVVDLQRPLAAVAEERLDQVGLMVDGHRHAVEALRGQLAHDHFENRVSPIGMSGFGSTTV